MGRAFPNSFQLRALTGERARQFTDVRDAFQQIVGDALSHVFGVHAFVATTKGNDGSIDAHITRQVEHAGNILREMPAPVIVECKHHDDSLSAVATNIRSEWRSLRAKLEKQAESGWPGLFAPWKDARSYVYCVGAAIPAAKDYEALTQEIRAFFDTLRGKGHCQIEQVTVLGWSHLRPWLDGLTPVADAWLGIATPSIQSHAEFVAGLTGFRRYLLDSELDFVPPPEDSPTHPGKILDWLEQDTPKPGLLLHGAGGVGKTRTSFEVAETAAKRGWRVLHVHPDEPAVTVDDLAEVVFAANDNTLLVFDYIDQQQLDLGALRHALLPGAAARGIRVALLANSRPLWMQRENPEREALFEARELLLSEQHRAQLASALIHQVAPLACAALGYTRVAELCGERPIIALFIARELEHRARSGTLSNESLGSIRSGDLMPWLRRRLDQDRFRVEQPSSPLELAHASPNLVAAAAALACAPGFYSLLEDAARFTLQAYDNREHGLPAHVLQVLLELGWLETRGSIIAAAHDVVADEMVDRVLPAFTYSRPREFDALICSALHRPRALGRFAITLDRVTGGLPETRLTSVTSFADTWMREHASELGIHLAAGGADETGYALAAAISTTLWSDTCVNVWNELLAPWLNAHGEKPEARHLLYKGLKALRGTSALPLFPPALAWLSKNGLEHNATYVLAELLDHPDLPAPMAQEAIARALEWLSIPALTSSLDAQFVLNPLMKRTDLGARVGEAVAWALEWLEHGEHAVSPDARFVLHPLLGRMDLGARSGEAIARALKWLEHGEHATSPEAQFVLHPLLGRTDLRGRSAEAIARALEWLSIPAHATSPEAQFVLHPLLGRTDLGERSGEAIARALKWLEHGEHATSPEAQFVLHPLLGRTDLGGRSAEAIELALQWLSIPAHATSPEAQFVLHPLLGRTDLGERPGEAVAWALKWLEHGEHAASPEAGFVLAPLLGRTDLGERSAEAIVLALEWLSIPAHATSADAGFVLPPLLGLCSGNADEFQMVAGHTLFWLRTNLDNDQADFVFKKILRSKDTNSKIWRDAASLAVQWVRQNPESTERDYILNSIVLRPELLAEPDLLFVVMEMNRLFQSSEIPSVSYKAILRLCTLARDNHADSEIVMHVGDLFTAMVTSALREKLRNDPNGAACVVPPLLGLAVRAAPTNLEMLLAAVRDVLADPRIGNAWRGGIVRECREFLEDGVFGEDEAAARAFLREQGILI